MADDTRTAENFVNDLTLILSLEGLHVHTRRAVVYKAIEDYSKILVRNKQAHWSKRARDQWEKGIPTKLILEHPVPKSLITKRITPRSGSGPKGEQLRADLYRAFKELMPICWVLKEEDKRLRDAELKQDVPGSPAWESIDPWSRYKHPAVSIEVVGGYESALCL